MKWKVNGKYSDCMSDGVDFDFAVEVDGGYLWISEGHAFRMCLMIMVLWKWAVWQR